MKKFNLLFGGICLASILSASSCKISVGENHLMGYEYKLNEDERSYSLYFTESYKKRDHLIADLTSDEGVLSKEITELRVPSLHKDLPVTKIVGFDKSDMGMFGDNLQHYMYHNYSNLKDVILPDCLERLDGSFLVGFDLNTNVYNTEHYIKSETNDYFYLLSSELDNKELNIHPSCEIIGAKAFKDCSWYTNKVKQIILPENLKSISNSAFYGAGRVTAFSNIQNISLPKSLLYIGDNAFSGIPLMSINIPSNVKKIGKAPFYINSLKIISVDSENLYYESKNTNALFEKETKKLITLMTDARIPKDTLIIGEDSIHLDDLDEFRIPEGVEEIQHCTIRAKEVYLPSTIKKVGDVSFASENVYYPGTIREFKRIFAYLYSDNYSHHVPYHVVCSDGVI